MAISSSCASDILIVFIAPVQLKYVEPDSSGLCVCVCWVEAQEKSTPAAAPSIAALSEADGVQRGQYWGVLGRVWFGKSWHTFLYNVSTLLYPISLSTGF